MSANPLTGDGAWLLIAGLVVGLVWTAGACAFFFGFYGDQLSAMSPVQTWGMALVALGPALLLGLLGAAARELARFSHTAQALRVAAGRLAAPVDSARADARSLAEAVAGEIETLNTGAEAALARLAAMEEELRHHAESMQAASGEARAEIDGLIARLGNERAAIAELSDALSKEAKDISSTIDRQAEMVAAAADLAATHAEEGQAKLNASAEGLSNAGRGAQEAVERVALSIDEQIRDLEALVTALEKRAEAMERAAAGQADNVRIAKETADQLSMAADAGSSAMRGAVDEAIQNANRLAEIVAQETARAAQAGAEEIERVRRAAQAAREAAEAAGRALEANTQTILERVDRVNASAFDAVQRTDEAYDARRRSGERAISAIDDRIAPSSRSSEPRDRDARRALEDGLDVLEQRTSGRHHDRESGRYGVSGRAAPEPSYSEPRYPEPGHPERERSGRNASSDHTDYPPSARGDHRDDPRRGGVAPADFLRGDLDDDDRDDGRRDGGGRDGAPQARTRDTHSEKGAGSSRRARRRGVRLGDAPDADAPSNGSGRARDDWSDDDALSGPAASGGAGATPLMTGGDSDDGWRWRDLLKNLDDAPQGAMVGEAVIIGLRRAGVDPATALDPDMTARIARARRRAGSGEARALVLDGAMDAVRRTAGALAADPSLRQRSEEFLDEHSRRVRRAIDENDAAALSTLLDSDLGRAFLLVDAALSDV